MPQKNKLEDQDELINEEQTHKKIKTSDDNGVEKNGNGKANDEIIDGVQTDAPVEAEVKNGNTSKDEQLGLLLISGGVNWDLVGRKGKYNIYKLIHYMISI